jgi:hypothetical protein
MKDSTILSPEYIFTQSLILFNAYRNFYHVACPGNCILGGWRWGKHNTATEQFYTNKSQDIRLWCPPRKISTFTVPIWTPLSSEYAYSTI